MMHRLRIVKDINECRRLWEKMMPRENVTDLWEFRACFHRHYQRSPVFLVVENQGRTVGFLPLSWIEEAACLGYFPGEIWDGKTWIEQNRLIVRDQQAYELIALWLSGQEASYHLRYLLPSPVQAAAMPAVDEIGYLFNPPQFGYDMDNYFGQFSHKSIKRIKAEIAQLEARQFEIRRDCAEDFELMVQMNIERYGLYSYFGDPRFKASFYDVMKYFAASGWLRMTTVMLDGEPAAIDMGCIYKGTYTLIAGGTNARFPGVAKLINLHHMRRACEEKFRQVDFLCGDFSWKSRFHLTPRPLHLLSNIYADAAIAAPMVTGNVKLPELSAYIRS